jgi:hypothetical protein
MRKEKMKDRQTARLSAHLFFIYRHPKSRGFKNLGIKYSYSVFSFLKEHLAAKVEKKKKSS